MKYDKNYCIGKGAAALQDIQSIFEALKREDLSVEELKTTVYSSAYCALYDFTKILSCVAETEWSIEDRDKVAKEGNDGVEELLVRYGWLSKQQTHRYRLESATRRIYQLSQGSKAQSRTLMHEVLLSIPERTPPFEPLRDILEAVTQGTGKWEDVQIWCEAHLKDHESKQNA